MTVPVLQAAVCALVQTIPQNVTLLFQVPVTSASFTTGLSMTANAVALPIVSASASGNTVVIVLSGGPSYNTALTVSYDATVGDWNNGGNPVATFTGVVVTNASQVGTPSSEYPLSLVTTEQLVGKGGAILATLNVNLNIVDQNLVAEYQPQFVDFGGTYGITLSNPAGVMILQNLRQIVDGLSVTATFYVLNQTAWSAAAAADWEVQNRQKVANVLAGLRTLDTTIDYGQTVITQV